jgi:hypothetical protein
MLSIRHCNPVLPSSNENLTAWRLLEQSCRPPCSRIARSGYSCTDPRLSAQRTLGKVALLISEEMDKILNLSDRIAVIYEDQIMGVANRDGVAIEQLSLMMAGIRPDSPDEAPKPTILPRL